jgi:hypothetical protein
MSPIPDSGILVREHHGNRFAGRRTRILFSRRRAIRAGILPVRKLTGPDFDLSELQR